jgi:hypothetical protein
MNRVNETERRPPRKYAILAAVPNGLGGYPTPEPGMSSAGEEAHKKDGTWNWKVEIPSLSLKRIPTKYINKLELCIMNTLGNRLKQLCEALGESPTQFATVRLGYSSPSKLYNWIAGKFYPKEDSFQLIEERVPNLNGQWLRKGIGSMFEGNQEIVKQESIPIENSNSNKLTGVSPLPSASTLEALQLENAVLKEKIALLERYLERLERTHDTLLGKI